MMRAAKQSALSVQQILCEAQRSSAVHVKCARLLWSLQQADPARCSAKLKQCLAGVLLIAQARCVMMILAPTSNPPTPGPLVITRPAVESVRPLRMPPSLD